jgi:hypothetical protein
MSNHDRRASQWYFSVLLAVLGCGDSDPPAESVTEPPPHRRRCAMSSVS